MPRTFAGFRSGWAAEETRSGTARDLHVQTRMARSRALGKREPEPREGWEGPRPARVQIGEECLELVPETPDQVTVLRRWVRQVNGPNYPQPFLQEGPPGCFRLYVRSEEHTSELQSL